MSTGNPAVIFQTNKPNCDGCRRHGAEEVEPSASGGTGRSQAFQGRAYRLGDSEAASEVISSAARLPDHPQVMMSIVTYINNISFMACCPGWIGVGKGLADFGFLKAAGSLPALFHSRLSYDLQQPHRWEEENQTSSDIVEAKILSPRPTSVVLFSLVVTHWSRSM